MNGGWGYGKQNLFFLGALPFWNWKSVVVFQWANHLGTNLIDLIGHDHAVGPGDWIVAGLLNRAAKGLPGKKKLLLWR